jgi:murein DD-endopeptidase MepM/ murein hydrolase activator NlpD
LADQKKVIVYNTEQKNKVLSETQNKEAIYQQQLAEKKALRDAVQKEINEYESQLRLAVDPTSYPSARAGILSWPLSKVTITQYFGNTAFATANAAIYGGQGHNAIDLAAVVGTPIKSAAAGVVQGFGDTDLTCPGASYGRWILVKHTNGLSTLYAHLSVISVSSGQTVQTGETIGYSGNTGYSTGPHLHFGVYASQGVQLVNRPSAACGGKVYYMPVADYKAYLNPLSYLPAV